MSEFVACPNCSSRGAGKVGFTWWGGVLGPSLLTHVKCPDCGTAYNGRTGASNTGGIVAYVAVSGAIAVAAVAAFFLWLR